MAGLGGSYPDFDGLLDGDQPKDTEVIIEEENQEEGSPTAGGQEATGNKRKRQGTPDNNTTTLQAHWVVLRSLSPCFRAKLERWCKDENNSKQPRKEGQSQVEEQPPPYQYSLQLLVPPGQLKLGRRLITAMYSSSPDLSDLEAPQLLQLVALAECYGVGKVVDSAAAQLHQLSVKSMPLDVAASVFELPEACLALEAVQPVQQAAADKLQQELGDLEVAWGTEAKQQQLLGLPFGALLQLLRDERTRVASEDTAVYTALQWLEHNPSPPGKQQEQQAQLVGLLRLPQCTATFLAWLSEPSPQPEVNHRAWVYGSSPKLLIDLLAASGRSSDERHRWLRAVHQDKPTWRGHRRPPSALTQLQLSWDLPLRQLEESWAGHSAERIVCTDKTHPSYWQGRRWWLSVEHTPGSGRGTVFVCCNNTPGFVTTTIAVDHAREGVNGPSVSISGTYLTTGRGYHLLAWGADREEWPQVKAWLQEQGLVHPDGCLHLRATVTHVE